VQLLNGFIPATDDKFLVIDNRGSNPIGVVFSNLPDGATLWAGPIGFTISDQGGDGNDVVLTFSGLAQVDLSGRVFNDRNNDGLAARATAKSER
jgi:hypothetical protein